MRRSSTHIRIALLVSAVLLLEILCQAGAISPLQLTAPSRMATTLAGLMGESEFWQQTTKTIRNIFIAIILATVLGFLIGLLLFRLPRLRRAMEPVIASYYALPFFVLYPLAIVVVGMNRFLDHPDGLRLCAGRHDHQHAERAGPDPAGARQDRPELPDGPGGDGSADPAAGGGALYFHRHQAGSRLRHGRGDRIGVHPVQFRPRLFHRLRLRRLREREDVRASALRHSPRHRPADRRAYLRAPLAIHRRIGLDGLDREEDYDRRRDVEQVARRLHRDRRPARDLAVPSLSRRQRGADLAARNPRARRDHVPDRPLLEPCRGDAAGARRRARYRHFRRGADRHDPRPQPARRRDIRALVRGAPGDAQGDALSGHAAVLRPRFRRQGRFRRDPTASFR